MPHPKHEVVRLRFAFQCGYCTDDLVHGRCVLHPLLDDTKAHVRQGEDHLLHSLTETGRFHIALLRLNRPALVEHRRRRHLAALWARRLAVLAEENAALEATIVLQEAYLELLRQYP